MSLILLWVFVVFSFISSLEGTISFPRRDSLESDFQSILGDLDHNKITVVFTLYSWNQVNFCIDVLKAYSKYPYTELIGNLIVIWNNVYMAVPLELNTIEHVVVIKGNIKSLNNRWILMTQMVTTTAVLIHDDDMLMTVDGLQCMFEAWRGNQERLVTPFVRQISLNNSDAMYINDELHNASASYSLGTRLIMFSIKYLHVYAASMNQELEDYLTHVRASCDDMALNMVSSLYSRQPPLRMILPPSSILSFDTCSHIFRGMTFTSGGKGTRSICAKGLNDLIHPRDALISTNELAICPATEKIDRSKSPVKSTSFTTARINCKDMPKYIDAKFIQKVYSSASTPTESLLPIPSVNSTSIGTFRLGIIAVEFWSVEMDGHLGKFGHAAWMASLALKNAASPVSVHFLHASKLFDESPGACTNSLVKLHSQPVLLRRKDEKCYQRLLRSLQLDAVMTIDFRRSYVNVLKHIPDIPVIVWVLDLLTPEKIDKIRNNQIPSLNGTTLPLSVYPSSGFVEDSLKYHHKVIFAVTFPYLIPQYPPAYSFAPLPGYLTPQLPYAMDVFGGTDESSTRNPSPRVICMECLDPVQRPWLFVEAARRMPHIEFVLIGEVASSFDGIGFGFSEETRQPSNLIMIGHVEGRKKKELFSSAWLLVSTAIHEEIPLSLMEALQMGIPIVATHDPDGITTKFGIFVGNYPTGGGFDAVPKVTAAIYILIKDSHLRKDLGAAGKAWIAEHHSTKNFNQAFQSLRSMILSNQFAPLATKKTTDQLAVCAVFLNEDDTIVEWIEYHLMLGVSKFFLYHLDNHATRNRWRRLLWPYVAKGQVVVHAMTVTYLGQWSNRQAASLQQCYDTYRNDFRWLAFIDVDEFLVPRDHKVKLTSLLRAYEDESGLAIPWRTFGPAADFDQTRGKQPRITEVTKATIYDQRGGLIPQLAGNVKVIVNTFHYAADHCHFLQNGGILNDKRFIHYAHNCLYNAPSPPVDEHFRPVSSPWMLRFPATSDIIQLNHYFARTCQHFFGQRRNTRLASIRARYGNNVPAYYRGRLGLGFGNTKRESCATMQKFFNTTDTSIVALGQRLWTRLDSRDTSNLPVPPPRGSCDACLPDAYCIDVLQRNYSNTNAEYVCHEPLVGDGRTFCGNVTWAARVETDAGGDFSYLLGAPDGDTYASHWGTDPRSSFFKLYFSRDGQVFSNVRLIVLYQPIDPSQVVSLHYITSSPSSDEKTKIKSNTFKISGKYNPTFLEIPVDSVDLSGIEIQFDEPIALGGVGIVVG